MMIAVAGGCGLFLSCGQTDPTVPPVAKKQAHTSTIHGLERVDNYFWLRERDNPDVIDYLEAENAHTEAMMAGTVDLQLELYDEIVARIKQNDFSVPEKRGDYYYYTRTEEGLQYKIHCRKLGSLEADEEIILDENLMAAGQAFFRLGVLRISPDHRLAAFAVDTTGNERYRLGVKNLKTGEIYRDAIDSVSTELEWAADNRTIFYTVADDAWRDYRLYRHVLGADRADDVLVYEEPDEMFWLSVSKTKSQAYLLLTLGSITSDEVHYLPADDPTGLFRMVSPRRSDVEYDVYHHDSRFYIVTNDEALNFRLVEAPVSGPIYKNWREVIGNRNTVKLDGLDMFAEHMVLYEREEGLTQISIYDFASGDTRRIEFDAPTYSCWGEENPDFNSQLLRFGYESMTTPETIYDYDLVTNEREVKKQKEVLGGYDPDDYVEERLWAEAPDGVSVPVSLVYRKDMRRDEGNPLYLYAYGAYGSSWDPYFSNNRVSLLDRGFVFALAHVRGGEEMGRHWYDDGRMLNKKNTFTDFIAVAENLVKRGYTTPDKLVCSGGSAGGLLIGAVVTQRPDLFAAAIADVPFVDVINTMLDPDIPLTVIEYEEWGNPNIKEQFDYMLSYSPYDQVQAQAYPAMLITAGLHDTRVQYWEPAKWTAKLRAHKTDTNRLLLKTNMGCGHGGSSGRYERIREIAFEYAFVLDVLQMTD
jgi:oligopeptidase B